MSSGKLIKSNSVANISINRSFNNYQDQENGNPHTFKKLKDRLTENSINNSINTEKGNNIKNNGIYVKDQRHLQSQINFGNFQAKGKVNI